MKKFTLFTLFILVLAACNSPQESSENEQADDIETEEAVDGAAQEEEEKEENAEEKSEQTEDGGEMSAEEEEEQDTAIESTDENEKDKHQEIVDLAYDIFDAQNDNDYDFLQSVISKGTKLDKKNTIFIFENVTYPHEQEFLTDDDLGELELRYTHEENADSVIVGFGAIDYENESSFVIDFEFIKEDGKWKMNDMDINK
ncbi:lipoprotein [Pseudogracilibacillus sp. SO30301A]|uniref:lipoprotein n=1 Tax=Pseudogracilibacillus sp. SO30301A TaxID=3098291 RepID=UPI00300E0FB0